MFNDSLTPQAGFPDMLHMTEMSANWRFNTLCLADSSSVIFFFFFFSLSGRLSPVQHSSHRVFMKRSCFYKVLCVLVLLFSLERCGQRFYKDLTPVYTSFAYLIACEG